MAAATTSSGKRRSPSAGESDRSSPDHRFSPAPSTRSSNKQQIRHRASIACASCRERRIRCVVQEGETECAQCRRTGATCIIKDDDERRRPISKAYMSSLSNRIALLEEMLKERGVVPPPAVHPPKTRQEAQARQQQEQQQAPASERSTSSEPKSLNAVPNQPPTPPASGDEDVLMSEPAHQECVAAPHDITALPTLIDPILLQDGEPRNDTGLRRLLCPRGSHTFDNSAGRVRFFGPTANSHVYARSSWFGAQERPDQARRAERVIGALRPSTHDHLMRCFWEYYNSSQQVVDEIAFETGRTAQDPGLYSPFLHITMLAMGYRFADWDREDVKRITLGNRESTLHQASKSMLEMELEMFGGVPSVQALLLLADLECGVGRDTTGWMYSGMANRLALDIGLHVSPSGADVTELERLVRRRVMAACVMFDRRWALLLGRPTTIKIQDVGVDVLPRFPGKPPANPLMGTAVASHAAIYQQLFELMELAGKVADFQNSMYGAAHAVPAKGTEDRAYLHFLGLERLFQNWYRRLPENLAWKPANIRSAHMGFFMLHQQFHVCMILLHRPWAKYGPLSFDGPGTARYPSPDSPDREKDGPNPLQSWIGPLPHHDNRASVSRSMCTQHAVRVARIFWHHRQRFDGRRIGLSAIQHAGTAALALMAALAHKSAELDHHSNLRYLQVLSTAIYDMSHSYQPAARMYHLLRSMLVDIRTEMVKSCGFDVSTVISRHHQSNAAVFGSSYWTAAGSGGSRSLSSDRLEVISEEDRAVKRRRLSSHSSIDLSSMAPSFSSTGYQACPSPPGSSQSNESSNAGTQGQITLEIPGFTNESDFDLDLLHASFIDFMNNGPSNKDWGTTASAPEPAEKPNSQANAPESTSSLNGTESTISKSSNTLGGSSSGPPQAVDDDKAVEMTIEEWLAEPSEPAIVAPSGSTQRQRDTATAATDATYSTNSPQADFSALVGPEQLAPPTELEAFTDLLLRPSGATDPHSPTTDSLGLGLDLIDVPDSAVSVDGSGSAGTGVEWIVGAPPPVAGPGPAAGDGGGVGVKAVEAGTIAAAAAASRPPMTPVTLDDLLQSVEEAVGSARARAQAKARARAEAGAGAGCGEKGGEGSPMGRNRELDFLSL